MDSSAAGAGSAGAAAESDEHAHAAHHDTLAWASPLLDRERRAGLHFAPSSCASHGGTGMGGLPRLVVMLGWWQSNDRHLRKYVGWLHAARAHATPMVSRAVALTRACAHVHVPR